MSIISSINRSVTPASTSTNYMNPRVRSISKAAIGRNLFHDKRSVVFKTINELPTNGYHVDKQFIELLVSAAQCRQYRSHTSNANGGIRSNAPFARWKKSTHVLARNGKRCLSTEARRLQEPELSTREELLSLVGQQTSESSTDHLPLLELPNLLQNHRDSQLVRVPICSNIPADKTSECPSHRFTWPAHGESKSAVNKLKDALRDERTSPDILHQIYKTLPAPRIPFLASAVRRKLLRRLGNGETKNESAMLQYMSVVEDIQRCSFPMTLHEWNTAVSLVTRYVSKTTEVEVESALRMWKEMEQSAGLKGSNATFNILFNAAIKAGKFRLSGMIHKEMQDRGLPLNRFHYVTLIHQQGLRRDGDGIRKAYRELVGSGEIVDTVVLNCLISSFLRAGEPKAAEHVYDRMKALHLRRTDGGFAPRDHRRRRTVNRVLANMANLARKEPSKLRSYQEQSIVAPDVKTYRSLIFHTAAVSGDIDRVVILLDEMRWFDIPLDGPIFISIFKGFYVHGGLRYSMWDSSHLQRVWTSFWHAANVEGDAVYLGKWPIMWALKAFYQCSGKEKALEIWQEVQEKWKPGAEELDHVNKELQSLVESP